MSEMEKIVRPFQSPTFINEKQVITTLPKVAKTSGVLEWGSQGAPPTVSGLSFNTKKNDKDYTEKERTTTPVRVQNPDDPNQYIMELRTDTIKFDVKNTLPTPTQGANNSGSSAGSQTQTAWTQSDAQQKNLDSYNALIKQGVDPTVASSMVYGSTSNGPIPKEAGPDSANYKLKNDQ